MKAFLALAVAMLALSVLATPGAAASGSPSVQTGVQPTELHPSAPAHLDVGVSGVITAILHDSATETGLPGQNLTFSKSTKFGWLLLKETVTDSQGSGYLDYDPLEAGSFTIKVGFAGNSVYAPSNATVNVTALAPPGSPPPLISTEQTIVLVILAVVGGVWATYGFVALQILGIREDRPEPGRKERRTRSASEEKNTMEAEEPSPKRVPGTANANRTALLVGIVALVLGAAGLGLGAMGALSPKATYTPTTVSLQVAIVADLQGDGWDVWLPNELVVHKGDTVRFTVINADEMDHGFNIPDYGIDVHIDPATINTTGALVPEVVSIPSFVADQAGTFLIKCNVVCGPGHDKMIGTLVVLPD